ncbi:AP-2 complex subunit beta [Acipenser ruthenus]|uniref:AP-2 complex subunit beta n=1 Tax=Acipenser ruthenus TaxID=7906 RepID=A0A662YMZ9_ACIRT|nr:AP-2 complex subunit beta [Acipenser ruthenus]
MTVGKDVSSLFPDVVNCMQTDNLELKKLVYLYLMNYAKSQPDMAIMAVNSFVKVGQNFIPSSVPTTFAPSPTPAVISSGLNDLFELSTGMGIAPGGHVAPKAVWLPAVKAKGLEIAGTFSRRQGHMYMDMTFTNKALQHMLDFAIQFNKNSFGVIPTTPLAIHTPLMPNQSIDVSLPLNTIGPVMKMDPLNNLQVENEITIQIRAEDYRWLECACGVIVLVAVKNSIDVFYFSCLIPLSIFFVEDGKMERQVFLATWKDIPNENELQYQIKECHLNADTVSGKLQNNNIYTIAKRNVEGQDMLYQSLKLTNGIWILAELRIQPGNPNYTVITSSAPSLPAPQSSGAAPLLGASHRLHQPIVIVEVRASAV